MIIKVTKSVTSKVLKGDSSIERKRSVLKKRKKNAIRVQVSEPTIKNVSTDLKPKKRSKLKKRGSAGDVVKPKELYDEQIQSVQTKLRVNADTVQCAVEGLLKFTSENPKVKKQLFSEQFPLFLQVNLIKIPTDQKFSKLIRLPLRHSLLTPDSEICLIVADVKGIKNKEHEKHLEYYEDLLRKKGVTCIKKIMTFHEFRTEYETFELRNRLVNLYDHFLVDGRISGKVVHKCGKIFYNKRKIPTAVKLQATKLNDHIQKSLTKSTIHIHGKGDSFVIQFGHSGMLQKVLVENIFTLLDGLDKNIPGGFNNIRSLNIYTVNGLSWPIYCSLKKSRDVLVPMLEEKKPVKGQETVRGELSTMLNADVVVEPTGKVTVKRKKAVDDEGKEKKPKLKKEDKISEKQESESNSSPVTKVILKKKKVEKLTDGKEVKKHKGDEKNNKVKKSKKTKNVGE